MNIYSFRIYIIFLCDFPWECFARNCETFPPPTSFLPRAQVLLSLIAIHSSRGVVRAAHSYWQSFMVKIISLDMFFFNVEILCRFRVSQTFVSTQARG